MIIQITIMSFLWSSTLSYVIFKRTLLRSSCARLRDLPMSFYIVCQWPVVWPSNVLLHYLPMARCMTFQCPFVLFANGPLNDLPMFFCIICQWPVVWPFNALLCLLTSRLAPMIFLWSSERDKPSTPSKGIQRPFPSGQHFSPEHALYLDEGRNEITSLF